MTWKNQNATHSQWLIDSVSIEGTRVQLKNSVWDSFLKFQILKHKQWMGILDTCDTTCTQGYNTSLSVSSRTECMSTLLCTYFVLFIYQSVCNIPLYVMYIYFLSSSSQMVVFVLFCISNKICWMFCFTLVCSWHRSVCYMKFSQIMYRKLRIYVVCMPPMCTW